MRLDVPVYDLILMGMIQRITDLGGNTYGFVHLQWSPFFDNLIQILAFHVLHNNIMNFIFLAHIIYTNHIWM
ncbi:hypothetical protein D3C73_624570 [compost metagenome]